MALKNQALTVTYYAWNISTGDYQSGDAANHSVRGVGDGTIFTPAAGPAEVSAANMKGAYTIALVAAEMNYNSVTVGGMSSTANVRLIPVTIITERGVLPTAAPGGLSGLPLADASGGVKHSVGTGLGQLNASGGKVPATLAASDVSGNLPSDLQTIKTTSTVTAAASVAFPSSIGTSTFAGGAVASVTAATTVAGYSSGQDPATLVLGATASSWNTATTIGNKINAAAAPPDPLASTVPGAYTSGQAGYALGNMISTLMGTTLPGSPGAGSVGEAWKFADTRLDAAITTRQPSGNVTIAGYATGQDPATSVWGALTTSFGTAGTFGGAVGGLAVVPDPALVQAPAAVASTSTAPAATFAAATTAGNFLVATLWTGPTPGTITPPSGWTLAVTAANTGTASIYYRANAPATTTVTFGLANSVRWGFAISEWSNVVPSSPVDVTGSSASSSGSITTNQSHELLIAVIDDMNGAGAPTSFTNSFTLGGSTTSVNLEGAWGYRVVTATNTYTTNGNAGTLNGVIAGFKALATGGTGGSSDPWATPLPGSYSTGQAGAIVGNMISNLAGTLLPGSPVAGSWGEAMKFVDTRLDAAITTRQPSGNVTVAGYASGQDPATSVWNATASLFNTSLSMGSKLNAAGSGGDPLANSVPGAYTSGQAGYVLGNLITTLMATTLPGSPGAGSVGEAWKFADTRLDAAITTRQPSGNVTVAGYASGQAPDALVWGASVSSYTTLGTFGQRVGAYADPWATDVAIGYSGTQAGNVLNNHVADLLATVVPASPFAGSVGEALGYADTRLDVAVSSRTTGNVTVGGYASGQDPPTLFLAASIPTSPGAATVGEAMRFVDTRLDAAITSRLASGNVTVGAYATGMDPAGEVWNSNLASYVTAGTFGSYVQGITSTGSPGGGTDPWATPLPGSYPTGQAGNILAAIGTATGKLNFDPSNNVLSKVSAYGTNLGPDFLVWNALVSTYNGVNTFGNKLQAAAAAGDPMSQVLPGSYGGTTVGGRIYQMSQRIDDNFSNLVPSLMGYSVETGVSYLQAIRAAGASAAGTVARVGSTQQFTVGALGNPATIRMTGVASTDYLTRTIQSLNL